MAVTKIWAIHDSVSRVVDYCTNPSKTKLSDLEQVLLYLSRFILGKSVKFSMSTVPAFHQAQVAIPVRNRILRCLVS